MEKEILQLAQFGEIVTLYGREVLLALVILVAGLIVAKLFHKYFRLLLMNLRLKESTISVINNILYVLILVFVIAFALKYAGMHPLVVRRILVGITLAVVGGIVIFRPLIPSLPFKVGNTVEAGGLLGKVEAITLLNTRLRTFDGKTVFVPNSKILNDNVINYHFIPNRQIRLVFGISYHDDLMKAKQVLAEILAEDPRVLEKPPAKVFVIDLGENSVQLAARPWVKNLDYWRTRCDLIEKVKLSFQQEGITIAFPQRDIHIYQEPADNHGPVQ